MTSCARCGGSTENRRQPARYCSDTCQKAAWRWRNPDKRAATVRGKTPAAAQRTAVARYSAKSGSAAKIAARRAVRSALAADVLSKEACLFCGADRVDAHHHDYSLPFAVTWLCRRHHKLAHRSVPA